MQLKNSFVGARRAADRARAREKVVKTLLQFIAGVISLLFMTVIAQQAFWVVALAVFFFLTETRMKLLPTIFFKMQFPFQFPFR